MLSLCADDFLECSCIPKPIASAGESASLPKWLSLASAQRCWQCIWRRLVLYPTLYPGLVEHRPDMTFRVGYVGRHWLLPVCDQEAEAKWLCPGTYSALYAMCSKRARKPWPGWCFQYWPGHIKSPAQSLYTVYDTKSQHVVATTTVLCEPLHDGRWLWQYNTVWWLCTTRSDTMHAHTHRHTHTHSHTNKQANKQTMYCTAKTSYNSNNGNSH